MVCGGGGARAQLLRQLLTAALRSSSDGGGMLASMARHGGLPRVTGDLDAAYLAAALGRAGVDAPVGELELRAVTDGRSGAVVTAIRSAGGRRWVHKAIRDGVGFHGALDATTAGEGALWACGALRLPPSLVWPVLDAVRHPERRETWLLMDDVSDGIVPPGGFDPDKLDRLLAGVAELHATYWDRPDALARLPLIQIADAGHLFGEPVVICGRQRPVLDGWVRWMIDDFVVGRYLPRFLEVLGPRVADEYLGIVEGRDGWLAELVDSAEPTLLHNDLRRANIAYLDDGRVALLDWERAARGPAAVDLTWLWFLQFWAYPPRTAHDPDAHRAAYLAALGRALGRPVDRPRFERAWQLGWVLVMSQLGYLLADALVENPELPRDEVAQRIGRARRAMDLARAALDR
jgi:hypothetical protein